MRKQRKCRNCGEEDNHEISGSYFYFASILWLLFVGWAALVYGVLVGVMVGTTVDAGWRAIAAVLTLMLFFWSVRAGNLYLPKDYEKVVGPPQETK